MWESVRDSRMDEDFEDEGLQLLDSNEGDGNCNIIKAPLSLRPRNPAPPSMSIPIAKIERLQR
jgi:hypothetical protein